jgi:putative addiction module CopG family antidote
MTITLPPSLAVFIGSAVRSGEYSSELEVLHQALRLLSDRDLGARVRAGIDSADRGELRDAETVFAEIKEKLLAEEAERKANPPRPISNKAIYNRVADAVDAIDMGHALMPGRHWPS